MDFSLNIKDPFFSYGSFPSQKEWLHSRDLILVPTLPLASYVTRDKLLLLDLSFFIYAYFSISSLQDKWGQL